MGRPSNTRQRRAEIITALQRVMATRGYDGASIGAIAEEAGLAAGLIHYHFRSKQEILLDSIEQLQNVLETRFLDLGRDAVTPEQRLRAFVDARLATGDGADPAAVASWVVIGAEAIRQPEVKTAYQNALSAQLKLLTQLLDNYAEGRLSARQIGDLAGIVLAAMEGAFQLSVSAAEIMPKDHSAAMVMALIDCFVRGTGGE